MYRPFQAIVVDIILLTSCYQNIVVGIGKTINWRSIPLFLVLKPAVAYLKRPTTIVIFLNIQPLSILLWRTACSEWVLNVFDFWCILLRINEEWFLLSTVLSPQDGWHPYVSLYVHLLVFLLQILLSASIYNWHSRRHSVSEAIDLVFNSVDSSEYFSADLRLAAASPSVGSCLSYSASTSTVSNPNVALSTVLYLQYAIVTNCRYQ